MSRKSFRFLLPISCVALPAILAASAPAPAGAASAHPRTSAVGSTSAPADRSLRQVRGDDASFGQEGKHPWPTARMAGAGSTGAGGPRTGDDDDDDDSMSPDGKHPWPTSRMADASSPGAGAGLRTGDDDLMSPDGKHPWPSARGAASVSSDTIG